MKGNVSAQEAVQWSKTVTREFLGGPKDKCVNPDEGLKANQIKANQRIHTKSKLKNIELVARPEMGQLSQEVGGLRGGATVTPSATLQG